MPDLLRGAHDTPDDALNSTDASTEVRRKEVLLKTGALQNAILNSANFSIIATDEKGVIQLFNIGAERMLGYAADEVVNRITPADIHDPQEVIARAAALSLELATTITPGFEALAFKASRGIEDKYELTYIRKDGLRFPAIVPVTALRDDQGAIIGYLLIGTDNSARKQVEERLRWTEESFRLMVESVTDYAIVMLDPEGRVVSWNTGAERIEGYRAEEIVGGHFSQFYLAEDVKNDKPRRDMDIAAAEGRYEDEGWRVRKDGSMFWANVVFTAIRDQAGNARGFAKLTRDLTGRKEAEAAQQLLDQRLRDQQFYTRSLIESNIDALMTTDPRGIITDINQQTEALTGCTRDELIGTPFKDYFNDPERAAAGIDLVLSENKVTNYELTARSKDGGETVVSFNATTFYDRERELQGVFAAARDVTERKRLDHALQEKNIELERARAAAEKANLAKSDFLSCMSHELRSPLNAILGFAQVINSDSPPPTASQMASIDQILHAGWYLLELINEILDLAQIESGKLALSLEPTSLAEVMLECQAMIEPQGQKRGVTMRFPQFDIPCFVIADRTRLKQIFINLLSNAIKYNQANGTVMVECTACAGERIRVSVTDTGAGLPPNMVAQLFQPFNRLGQERGTEEGTGIGLVTSKRLVELMGGAIGVESTVGLGSVFWFELKMAAAPQLVIDKEQPAEVAQAQIEQGSPRRTLLYVEDNPANLKLVEQLIARRPDMRLLSARDGNMGILLARANQPEVILMDINLPGISGIEALKILREDPATAKITVVALSANAMPRDIEKGLQAGFFRYLTKPIRINEFMDTLDMALDHASRANPRNMPAAPMTRPAASASLAELERRASGLRILLADDVEENRTLILMYLKRTRSMIDVADNGAIAVEMFGRSQYDLVLMDAEMPVMDGYAATREIRRTEGESGAAPTPIIALTAHTLAEVSAKGMDAGFTGFLTKPLRNVTLLEALIRYGRPGGVVEAQAAANAKL
jgi:PAS domain S-box-containing protein